MQPVILSGMFRSGTTLLWRFLSADPVFTRNLVEPLHRTLPQEIERWPHYQDYRRSPGLLDLWSEDFCWKHLVLLSQDRYPELKAYLDKVLTDGTLAKFTRLNLRLSWVMARYPGVPLVNIVRDPRAVCVSMLKHSQVSLDSLTVDWRAYNAQMYFQILSHYPAWSQFLSTLKDARPFVKVLAVWKIVVERALASLDERRGGRALTVHYEDMVRSPAEVLGQIYGLWQSTPPEAVLAEARTGKREMTERKWQAPVSDAWMEEWRKVLPTDTWRDAIAQAGLEPVMQRLGYPLD